MTTKKNKYDVFISYSRKDIEKVKAIKMEIEQITSAGCWMDMDNIISGEDYVDQIVEGIELCHVFLFMLSRSSQESRYAIGELEVAIKQQRKKGIHMTFPDLG